MHTQEVGYRTGKMNMMRNMMLNVLALMNAIMVIGGGKKSLKTWMGVGDFLGPLRVSVSGKKKKACSYGRGVRGKR